jgi:hypothetical protein
MQGKNDRRSSKSKIDPLLLRSDYINGIIDELVNLLAPYASILGSFTYGNHETAIISKLEIDLLKMITHRLQVEHNSPVMLGGYSGWIVTRWKSNNRRQTSTTIKTFYRHSGGSYGQVSKGVLAVDRMQVMQEGADMVVSGDNHQMWQVPIMLTHLDSQFNICQKRVNHFQIPTFKDEFKTGMGGWHVETNKNVRPLGFIEVEFTPYRKQTNGGDTMFMEAKPILETLTRFT